MLQHEMGEILEKGRKHEDKLLPQRKKNSYLPPLSPVASPKHAYGFKTVILNDEEVHKNLNSMFDGFLPRKQETLPAAAKDAGIRASLIDFDSGYIEQKQFSLPVEYYLSLLSPEWDPEKLIDFYRVPTYFMI